MPHTIRQLGRELRDRTISPVELTQECLFRIEKLNPELNAFITVLAESALEDARSAEQEIGHGWDGLHPDDRERCFGLFMEAFQARRPYTMD